MIAYTFLIREYNYYYKYVIENQQECMLCVFDIKMSLYNLPKQFV